MNAIGFIFTLIAGALTFSLPRKWAALPLLAGAAYMTRGQVLDLGPVHFPVTRLLVVVGLARVLSKGERLAGSLNGVDRFMIAWAAWFVFTGLFHTSDGVVFRLGVVLTSLGSYFLFRVFVQTPADLTRMFKALCLLLIPVALGMLVEKVTGKNCFAALGGVWAEAAFRHGKFRAQGPFAHAILAGTVGAMCLPLALLLWREQRKIALIGVTVSGGIVYSSGSSGPIMTTFAILMGLAMWKVRAHLRLFFWLALVATFALDLYMKDPFYFVLARIDLTGGSTGWHRAALIQSAINHLGEWWVTGTDYTRHWMPTGVHSNEIHTDLTNFYIQMGVWGGLGLMFLFLGVLYAAFKEIGRALRVNKNAPGEQRFLIWTLGASLFGHITNFFSISYFDQSVVFFYLLLAMIGSLRAMKWVAVPAPEPQPAAAFPEYEPDLCHHS